LIYTYIYKNLTTSLSYPAPDSVLSGVFLWNFLIGFGIDNGRRLEVFQAQRIGYHEDG